MIKARITQPGAHIKAGKELQELKVGSVHEFEGDELPGFLVGKAVIVDDSAGELVTNGDTEELLNQAVEENAKLSEQLKSLQADNDTLKKAVEENGAANAKLQEEKASIEKELSEAKEALAKSPKGSR